MGLHFRLFGMNMDGWPNCGERYFAGLGGMKGITYTQVAQYCVMVFAYTIPVIFINYHCNAIPQMGLIYEYLKDGAENRTSHSKD